MVIRAAAGRVLAGCLVAGCLLTGCASTAAVNREPNVGTTTAAAAPDGSQQVTVIVNDSYRFFPSTITVHPGKVTVTLKHEGTGAPHNLQVTGFPADFVPLVRAGQTSSASFMAPAPGRYTFVCTIHEQQGQTGTLIVLPK